MKTQNSKNAFNEAVKHIPGGVNSPVRAFKSVGGDPLFIHSAKGAHVKDIDNNSYIDYVASWGPMILGHAHPQVIEALNATAVKGTSFGAPTLMETEMAELICSMIPSIESVRMVNSGTEATMSALRLARGYTKRDLVIKFEGCYHGHGDSFLIKAGSGALTLGTPDSPGITKGTARDTLTAVYNDLNSVTELFNAYKNQIAAVILEPVTGNMGVIKPTPEFIQGIRKACTDNGALLIFDEVMTGFRVAKGGAQETLGVTPDLTTLGKIIGGGLPVGAYGGKKEIMDMLAPNGPIYQAGTLSGNPMAMAAGLTTLRLLNDTPDFYQQLEEKTTFLTKGLQNNLDKLNFPGVINQVGSMFTLFFTKENEVNNFSDVMKCNTELFAKYFRLSLEGGVYMAPSQFEAGFVSIAHTEKDLKHTIASSYKALEQLKNEI
jgi:glutamate-1-semialdehyde 2,1-aminomutase